MPAPAFASGDWSWPVEGAVITAYGARYSSGSGATCTHGGVDLAARGGEAVRACSAGEVVFSGQVPAGEGERSWAVTVLTGDGLRVTYLPLRRSSVKKGAEVGPGASLGELASAGDASNSAPHLHLGVRRGEVRLDPLSLLGERTRPSSAGPVTRSAAPVPHADGGAAPAAARPVPRVAGGASSPVRAPLRTPARALAPPKTSQVPAVLPHASPAELPVLRRMAMAADTPSVRTAAVAADVASTRDFLVALLARLGLAGLAGCCVWPVLRRVLDGSARQAPVTVAVRRDGA